MSCLTAGAYDTTRRGQHGWWARRLATGASALVFFAVIAVLISPVFFASAATIPPLVAYEDPGKHFTLQYPRGWQVKRFPNDTTAFYLDDPDDGTAFWIVPALNLKGEMTAVQAMQVILDLNRKRYPDIKVVGALQRTGQAPMQSFVEVALTSTNARHVQMKGWANLGRHQDHRRGPHRHELRELPGARAGIRPG